MVVRINLELNLFNMRKITLLLTMLSMASYLLASTVQRELYIEQYRDLAISEMHRTGIPASIKLAQAILESNAGLSTLAREANNHFGIKCGSQWNGKTFYRKDDDRNQRGKLIKSCFRAFRDPVDSFMEHSDFLAVQNRKRYDFLFGYGTSDYTSWAFGLKKAGYATHREYPNLLIKLIEEYQLHRFDRPGGFDEIVAVNEPIYHAPTVTNTAPKKKRKAQTSVFSGGSAGEISMDAFKTKIAIDKINKVSVTYATEGDNIGTVAIRSGLSVKKLVKYNDGIDSYEQPLTTGTKVYLAKKKSSFKGKKKFHFVKAEDNMTSLAQKYGVQLKALYAMNAMPLSSEPAIGEKIRLKGKMPKGRKIKTRMLRVNDHKVLLTSGISDPVIDIIEEKEKPSMVSIPTTDVNKPSVTPEKVQESPIDNQGVVITWDTPSPSASSIESQTSTMEYHTVVKGETLWRISQRFETSVTVLRDLNNLDSNIIQPGQNLRIK